MSILCAILISPTRRLSLIDGSGITFIYRPFFTAVDCQHLASDKTGQIRCEEHHRIGDVLRRTQPLHRDALNERLLPVLAVALPLLLGSRVGSHETRRNAVDGYAERPELVRQLPRQ